MPRGRIPGPAHELAGSIRPPPEGAELVGETDPRERIVVSLYLKSPSEDDEPESASSLAMPARRITRRELARQRRAQYAEAAAAVAAFAARHGLTLVDSDLLRRRILLAGSASRMRRIFGADLRVYARGPHRFRARSGPLLIPEALRPWTRAVLGFDHRPQTKRGLTALAGSSANEGLWPRDIARLYGIPSDRDGAGQRVGVIQFGGGYLPNDLAAAAGALNNPPPDVEDRSIFMKFNLWGHGSEHDAEVALDLQILAGIAPRAKIIVYFAPNTAQGLAEAVHQAVFGEAEQPGVLSISWGNAEQTWTKPARDVVNAAFVDAARSGVSVIAAAGDSLATGGIQDGAAHVFYPASSPYVLGCGGTKPALAADATSIVSEVVWNDGQIGTGGGISDDYAVPDYQSRMALPPSVNDGAVRRGVPDVAGAAAQTPGYRIVLDGKHIAKDGTSAVAPLWAALIALANAERGRPIGFINPFLYADPALCRQITSGNNRVNGAGPGYDAGPGWNACTGLGVPKGAEILAAFTAMA